MIDLYAKRWYFRILMVISLGIGILFFYYNHLEFIIRATEQNKFHLSNAAYALLRPISCMILPMLFLFPSFFTYGRMSCVKYAYIIYGFFHILTTCWVVTFLMNVGHGYNILRYDHILAFQSTMTNAYVSSPVFWDTYNLMGVFFSWAFGALCIYTGLSFDENKRRVRLLVLAVLLFKVLAPMANNLIFGKQIISRYWLDHNLTDTFSLVFYTAAIWVASIKEYAWVDLVWDQEPNIHQADED